MIYEIIVVDDDSYTLFYFRRNVAHRTAAFDFLAGWKGGEVNDVLRLV